MKTLIYGELETEKIAKDNTVARRIVTEINQFGISERQRLLIIYTLALELESVDDMKSITSFIREHKGSDIFVSKMYDSQESEE